ncbi:hypothetical protein [Thiofilum flexile]|uniref:hypothetical protein n=1 Tax=Thiofilum flexile TaxID=125627 RepID=UPI0003753F4B|nr:hypothetical protein [Thiofilum flexile]
MTTLKKLALASLLPLLVWSATSHAWGEPSGSEVDRIDGGVVSIEAVPTNTPPPYNYRPERPMRPDRPYRPNRPGRYDPDYERERREFPMHSRRIDDRQHRQASRIENAYREGRLTRSGYMQLKREQNDIHYIEASMKSDMRLSRREIARLDALLDRAADNFRALSSRRYEPPRYNPPRY